MPSGDIIRRALEELSSARRGRYLAELAQELTLRARGEYVEAGMSPEAAAVGLRCHNEMLTVVIKQIRSDLGAGAGYPDEALLEVLQDVAKIGDRLGSLVIALHRAAERM